MIRAILGKPAEDQRCSVTGRLVTRKPPLPIRSDNHLSACYGGNQKGTALEPSATGVLAKSRCACGKATVTGSRSTRTTATIQRFAGKSCPSARKVRGPRSPFQP